MWFNRHTTDRNYSVEQKVNFESPVPFSKCLRAKIYCNMNVHFDPQGCQTLLLKESEPFLLYLGSWTIKKVPTLHFVCIIALFCYIVLYIYISVRVCMYVCICLSVCVICVSSFDLLAVL